MVNKKAVNFSLLIGSTFLGGVGQILFKYSFSFSSGLFAIYILLGILSYVVSTAIYFYVLSRSSLSWAYSIGGLSYIFTGILAFIFLHEEITLWTWSGILLISFGVALIGIS
ncbi:MAG: EamA family transporter [Candidatus Micrarchaeia archaeon]